MVDKIVEVFGEWKITKKEARRAVELGYQETAKYKEDILKEGDKVIAWLEENNRQGIVLAGRPYHVDPRINHGIPQLINSLGMAVLSEDSVARPGALQRPIRVVDQWTYHTRLYEAAAFVAQTPNLQLVQLNSFGCGIDAVTTDQTQEILESQGDIYTCLKIDEVSNLGAVRIRLRSLKVAMEEREAHANVYQKKISALTEVERSKDEESPAPYVSERVSFTTEMAKGHTLLAPQMAPTQLNCWRPLSSRRTWMCAC